MRISIAVDDTAEFGTASAMSSPRPSAVSTAAFEVPSDNGTRSEPPGALHPSGALDAGAAAEYATVAEQDVPAELLARAAALNALSAGRAPDLSVAAVSDAAVTAQVLGTTGAPANVPDPFACGLASGEFNGITNAGGPAHGSGVDVV
jgi:hypothetical protein